MGKKLNKKTSLLNKLVYAMVGMILFIPVITFGLTYFFLMSMSEYGLLFVECLNKLKDDYL